MEVHVQQLEPQPSTSKMEGSIGKNSSLPGKKTRITKGIPRWNVDSTHMLISLRFCVEKEFKTGKIKTRNLWTHISEDLRAENYTFSGARCEMRWRSLLTTFQKLLSEGNGGLINKVEWLYYETLLVYFKLNKMSPDELRQIKIIRHTNSTLARASGEASNSKVKVSVQDSSGVDDTVQIIAQSQDESTDNCEAVWLDDNWDYWSNLDVVTGDPVLESQSACSTPYPAWTERTTKRLIHIRINMEAEFERLPKGAEYLFDFWKSISMILGGEGDHFPPGACSCRWTHLMAKFQKIYSRGYYKKYDICLRNWEYFDDIYLYKTGKEGYVAVGSYDWWWLYKKKNAKGETQLESSPLDECICFHGCEGLCCETICIPESESTCFDESECFPESESTCCDESECIPASESMCCGESECIPESESVCCDESECIPESESVCLDESECIPESESVCLDESECIPESESVCLDESICIPESESVCSDESECDSECESESPQCFENDRMVPWLSPEVVDDDIAEIFGWGYEGRMEVDMWPEISDKDKDKDIYSNEEYLQGAFDNFPEESNEDEDENNTREVNISMESLPDKENMAEDFESYKLVRVVNTSDEEGNESDTESETYATSYVISSNDDGSEIKILPKDSLALVPISALPDAVPSTSAGLLKMNDESSFQLWHLDNEIYVGFVVEDNEEEQIEPQNMGMEMESMECEEVDEPESPLNVNSGSSLATETQRQIIFEDHNYSKKNWDSWDQAFEEKLAEIESSEGLLEEMLSLELEPEDPTTCVERANPN